MADFRMTDPPKSITDPEKEPRPAGYQEYPRHMHKWNEPYKVVRNDAEKQAALADGWQLQPQTKPSADIEESVEAAKRGPGRPKKE